ncbi:HD domain-containing protein [Stenotrophomonas indicatrix]|uniref:HD domain-containing protein n=1 Tax=Stenotrophomonas indicatrix TaxID=2045451 RepID=UPI00320B5405
MDWVAHARALATEAHASQRDKAGRPYIEHVARVAAAIHDDDAAKAAAWLHDVVEDCPQFADRVRDFPQPIHDAVTLLSRQSAPDAVHYYADIRQHPLALKVKLADIADNADPQRLRLLDPELAGRLQEKYSAALAELGERRSPQKTGSPASPQQRLQQMMEAARTLEQLGGHRPEHHRLRLARPPSCLDPGTRSCIRRTGSTDGTRGIHDLAHHVFRDLN